MLAPEPYTSPQPVVVHEYVYDTTACTMQGSIFTGNSAPTSQGGALAVEGNSTAQVKNCTFTSNAAQRGAAIFVRTSNVTVVDSNFTMNVARSAGKAASSKANLTKLGSRTVTVSWSDHVAVLHCVMSKPKAMLGPSL